MPSWTGAAASTALVTASGSDGPTSAAIGLPVIGVLVVLVVVGGIVYAVVRRR